MSSIFNKVIALEECVLKPILLEELYGTVALEEDTSLRTTYTNRPKEGFYAFYKYEAKHIITRLYGGLFILFMTSREIFASKKSVIHSKIKNGRGTRRASD